MNSTILYHADCVDGFTSAWIARKACLARGDVVQTIPVRYGEPCPDFEEGNLYILDFSYSREVVEALIERIRSKTGGLDEFRVIDHHKSAQKDLLEPEPLPHVWFDMDHCGAYLTWKLFFPNEKVPDFVRYVEDWDLWRFQLAYSKSLKEAVESYERDFPCWERLSHVFSNSKEQYKLASEGLAILRWVERSIEFHLKRQWKLKIDEHEVPGCIVSDKRLVSKIGHSLCESEDFSACIIPQENRIEISLRSRGFDVSEVAERFGGGGHQQAAGFVVPYPFEKIISLCLAQGLHWNQNKLYSPSFLDKKYKEGIQNRGTE